MTRNEILNMPAGREMDALIDSKVFGMVNISSGNPLDSDLLPHYSTDIAVAWEVVEKLKSAYPFRIHYQINEIPENKKYKLEKVKAGWYACFAGGEYFPVHADTAPLAICRAALVAVMDGKESVV